MKEVLEIILTSLTIIAILIGGAWAVLNHFWTKLDAANKAEIESRRDRVNRLEKLGAKFEEDVERLEAATDNLSKGYERISERSESLSKSVEKLDNTVGNLREAVAALRAGREKYLGEGASRVKGGDDG